MRGFNRDLLMVNFKSRVHEIEPPMRHGRLVATYDLSLLLLENHFEVKWLEVSILNFYA